MTTTTPQINDLEQIGKLVKLMNDPTSNFPVEYRVNTLITFYDKIQELLPKVKADLLDELIEEEQRLDLVAKTQKELANKYVS